MKEEHKVSVPVNEIQAIGVRLHHACLSTNVEAVRDTGRSPIDGVLIVFKDKNDIMLPVRINLQDAFDLAGRIINGYATLGHPLSKKIVELVKVEESKNVPK